jgi:hypothetical protein
VRSADNLHVPVVLKSGSLNLLEPSGPVQASNGIALLTQCVDHSNKGGHGKKSMAYLE